MTYRDEISALMQKETYDFEDLKAVMRILRSEDGCPWDREQDHHSIRVGLIEETYEVVEAIDREDPSLLREELGDLLFQILFHAQIEQEKNAFNVQDVINDITKKMIHRHPHVFGSVTVENSDEVLSNWEMIKTEEKQRNTLVEKLQAIPPMMPALMRASKVGKKLGQAEGKSQEALLDHVEAQLQEMRSNPTDGHEKERIGAILMAVTDLSRSLNIDAEHALAQYTDRVIDRVAKQN